MSFKVYNAAGEEKRHNPESTMAPSGVAFRAFKTVASSVAVNGTILFEGKSYDPMGYYDPSTGRFTPKIPGYYRITAQAHFPGNTSGVHYGISINKNGVSQSIGRTWGTGGAGGIQVEVDDEIYLNGSTDYVTVTNTGQNTESIHGSSAADWTTFTGSLIGSTVGVVSEPLRYVGDAGQPAFQSGWTRAHPDYERPHFYKDPNGTVFLGGMAGGNPNSVLVWYLPVGYRPAMYTEMSIRYWNGSSNVLGIAAIRATDGAVLLYNNTNSVPSGNGYYTLNGLTWRAMN